jgi:hypothetical protein
VAESLKLNENQLKAVIQGVALNVHANSNPNEDYTLFDDSLLVRMIRRVNRFVIDQEVIDDLEQRSGILLSPRKEVYCFAHRSFKEYLAACELVNPTTEFYAEPACIELAGQFPEGLSRLILQKPDLWLNVAQHAADLLRSGNEKTLWDLLPEIFEPYLSHSKDPAHAQAAMRWLLPCGLLSDGKHKERLALTKSCVYPSKPNGKKPQEE